MTLLLELASAVTAPTFVLQMDFDIETLRREFYACAQNRVAEAGRDGVNSTGQETAAAESAAAARGCGGDDGESGRPQAATADAGQEVRASSAKKDGMVYLRIPQKK